ncbi:MAG: HAMP domain-containing protein [Leptospiraceae bacterium]|nr:HAMP domain-containing protein [Leptospiraceae bacterium]MDW7975934.1 adenylate/guanylate cyclase domain-containing protein [Leptospiraceae bacterium]
MRILPKNIHYKVYITKTEIEEIFSSSNQDIIRTFCEKTKKNDIRKIILIVPKFNQDYEKYAIHCIQNNIQVVVLLERNLLAHQDKIFEYLKENERTILIFSKESEQLKKIFEKKFSHDPFHDDGRFLNLEQEILEEITRIKNKETETKNTPQTTQLEFEQVNESQKDLETIEKLEKTDPTTNETTKHLKETEIKINENKNNTNTLNEKPKMEQKEIHTTKEKKENIQIIKNIDFSTSGKEGFKLSKFTIRIKLLGIISVLVTLSLSLMIFIASYFFKRDIETQIQTNNSNLVQILGQKLEDLVNQIYITSEFIYQNHMKSNETYIDLFTFENPYIYSIAILKAQDINFTIQKWLNNYNLMQADALIREDFEGLISIYNEKIQQSLTNTFNLFNVSKVLNKPVLLMIAPIKFEPNTYALIFLNARKIINDFPSQVGSQTLLVNRYSELLIHSDINITLLQANVQDLPIIQTMQKSTVDNGLYTFPFGGKEYIGAFKKLAVGGMGIVSITESDIAFQQVFATQRRNLYILGIVLVLSVVIVYFFANNISIPLKELAFATGRVEEEDYSVRVVPRSKDEVGLVAYSFNKMVKGLEERERMKDAFGRFVNKEIAEKALRGEIQLGGEKKVCTIFFSDLRGFTAMSEKMKPEEVVEYLNRYFTLMVDCVEKTHGIVDKFIGDAIMATWGAVYTEGNDTENAINAALMMRKALIEFNKYNKEHNLPVVNFGCGINTGEVISGQIGSEKRLEFTVIGDAVNLASRIEGLNKPFATDILISQDAYERVKDIFNVIKMPAIKVKGKDEPQTIYCVLGRKDDPTAPKTLEELRQIAGIHWKPQITEDQSVLEDDKEEKFEILDKSKSSKDKK